MAPGLTDLLRVLVDPTRLRILALVEQGELSVGELARALALAQSRVSNHLRVLRETGLLAERHAGRTTFLSLAPQASVDGQGVGVQARLWRAVRDDVRTLPEFSADAARLERVLAERTSSSAEFFDRMAHQWDKIGADFERGSARERAAACLLPDGLVLADLGCGTGTFARALAPLAARLICIDRSGAMLEETRRKLARSSPATAIELRRGELDQLPLADDELDGCVAGMVLHHLADPGRACAEMARVLRPGGRAVVVELAPHKETWMQTDLGDRHLGLEPRDVLDLLARAGFVELRLEALEDRYRPRRAVPREAIHQAARASHHRASAGDDESTATTALSMYLVRGVKALVR